MENKYFIITIDTEGDNQWEIDKKSTTNNILYLPRFQELAEKYSFKPVWLSTYEMVSDKRFIKYFKKKQDEGLCEIGTHIHAWDNPPLYELKHVTEFRSYLIEYPREIMEKKIKTLTELIEKNFKVRPISHRSGRWATNEIYFDLLEKYGYRVDCSVTPHINWQRCLGETGIGGSDYTYFNEKEYYINKILEVPVTIRNLHIFERDKIHSFRNFLHEVKNVILGEKLWLRPSKFNNYYSMKKIIDLGDECIMFMIHSSELMPGGSPNFTDEDSIEKLYETIEKVFMYAKSKGYIGITLKEYYERKKINAYNK